MHVVLFLKKWTAVCACLLKIMQGFGWHRTSFSSRATDKTDQKSPCLKKKQNKKTAVWHVPTWQKWLPKPTMSCSGTKSPECVCSLAQIAVQKLRLRALGGGTCNWSEASENLNAPRSFFFSFLPFFSDISQPAVHWTGLWKGLRVIQQGRKQFSIRWPLISL